jgi:hypothetical protein
MAAEYDYRVINRKSNRRYRYVNVTSREARAPPGQTAAAPAYRR